MNGREECDGLGKVGKRMIKERVNLKMGDEVVVGEVIGEWYVEVEKMILWEGKNVGIEFGVIEGKGLLEVVRENEVELDENEVGEGVEFVNE